MLDNSDKDSFQLQLKRTVTVRYGFTSVDEIKRRNADAGLYYFTPETMRFFRSRVNPEIFGGRFFITSEQYRSANGILEPRKYSLRFAKTNGQIEHVSDFQQFSTLFRAKTAARKAAEDHHFIEEINGKWRCARIVSTNGQHHNFTETTLGMFDTETEAQVCRDNSMADIAAATKDKA